jgi:hypothetical protein
VRLGEEEPSFTRTFRLSAKRRPYRIDAVRTSLGRRMRACALLRVDPICQSARLRASARGHGRHLKALTPARSLDRSEHPQVVRSQPDAEPCKQHVAPAERRTGADVLNTAFTEVSKSPDFVFRDS